LEKCDGADACHDVVRPGRVERRLERDEHMEMCRADAMHRVVTAEHRDASTVTRDVDSVQRLVEAVKDAVDSVPCIVHAEQRTSTSCMRHVDTVFRTVNAMQRDVVVLRCVESQRDCDVAACARRAAAAGPEIRFVARELVADTLGLLSSNEDLVSGNGDLVSHDCIVRSTDWSVGSDNRSVAATNQSVNPIVPLFVLPFPHVASPDVGVTTQSRARTLLFAAEREMLAGFSAIAGKKGRDVSFRVYEMRMRGSRLTHFVAA